VRASVRVPAAAPAAVAVAVAVAATPALLPVPVPVVMPATRAVVVVPAQDGHQQEVDAHARGRQDEHEPPIHGLRVRHPPGRLDHEDAGHEPRHGDGGEGAEDLDAVEAEGVVARGGPGGDAGRDQGDRKARHVGEQVGRVRPNGDGVRPEAAHRLDGHEDGRDDQARDEAALDLWRERWRKRMGRES